MRERAPASVGRWQHIQALRDIPVVALAKYGDLAQRALGVCGRIENTIHNLDCHLPFRVIVVRRPVHPPVSPFSNLLVHLYLLPDFVGRVLGPASPIRRTASRQRASRRLIACRLYFPPAASKNAAATAAATNTTAAPRWSYFSCPPAPGRVQRPTAKREVRIGIHPDRFRGLNHLALHPGLVGAPRAGPICKLFLATPQLTGRRRSQQRTRTRRRRAGGAACDQIPRAAILAAGRRGGHGHR